MVKPRTADVIIYSIATIAVSVGLGGLTDSVLMSHYVPDPETPEGFSEFITLHDSARGYLSIAASGAVLFAFYVCAKEVPMWEMRRMRRPAPKRSPWIVSIGIGAAVMGFGMAAILFHQAHTMPESLFSDEYFDESIGRARIGAIVGAVGLGILFFGLLFAKVSDQEFQESLVYKRPLWHGMLVMAFGIAVGAVLWYYGSVSYYEYRDRNELGHLTLIMIFGLISACLIFLVGLFMWARNAPLIKSPYTPQTSSQDQEQK